MSKVSIIIPAYNEEQRLPATLDSVCSFMDNQKHDYEVLVVDDVSGRLNNIYNQSKTSPQAKNVPCILGNVRLI